MTAIDATPEALRAAAHKMGWHLSTSNPVGEAPAQAAELLAAAAERIEWLLTSWHAERDARVEDGSRYCERIRELDSHLAMANAVRDAHKRDVERHQTTIEEQARFHHEAAAIWAQRLAELEAAQTWGVWNLTNDGWAARNLTREEADRAMIAGKAAFRACAYEVRPYGAKAARK